MVCKNIYSTLRPLADDKGVLLRLSINQENTCVFADKAKLKQILYNLVSNAIKFTENGGTVSIDGSTKDDLVHISIIDTGIGIDKEGLDKLFTPFMQLESSESRTYEGTGLGLALSKEIVELHEGKIWAESEPGKGSIFTFTLPLCK